MKNAFQRSAEAAEYGGARMADIERGAKSGENYEFPMTLATEGEANDGHVLSIKGGQLAERMPLLSSHMNDPAGALGSVIGAEKMLGARPPKLRATGIIELGGTGPRAEIRNDVAHMIEAGHLRAVSLRWHGVVARPRRSLDTKHPYYVKEDADYPQRYGMLFEEWRAMEGSVVAVGADPKAVIGRAAEAKSEEAKTFWRTMAEDATPTEEAVRNRAAETLALALDMAREAKVPVVDLLTALGDALEPSREDVKQFALARLGEEGFIEYEDFLIPQAVANELATLRGKILQLTKPVAKVHVDEDAAAMIQRILAEDREQFEASLGEMFTKATGRILK